jgi:3-keto-L-gulonate-6-phosphate decarboxylase
MSPSQVVHYEILPLLRGVPLYGIVIGRGITAQPDPGKEAEKITTLIREIWPA